MTITLHGLKNCDTCRKAVSDLTAAGEVVELVDIRSETDLPNRLPQWIDRVGLEALVNKRSTTWRGLTDDQKTAVMDKAEISVLLENPTLIKRPVIERGSTLTVGWTAKQIATWISG